MNSVYSIIQVQCAAMKSWQQSLSNLITDQTELCELLNIEQTDLPNSPFALRVPYEFVSRMQAGNPQDPLLLQVLIQQQEWDNTPGYSNDPLHEQEYNALPGLIHKYKNRVLIVLTSSCAINCRYCFRRHFDYQDNLISDSDWVNIVGYLKQHSEIEEVIFSGGEPLLLKDAALKKRIDTIAEIQHIHFLRIHSRLPVVIPQRMTEALMQVLSSTRLLSTLVVHSNHANEINQDIKAGVDLAKQHNITVFNQAVLLKGINDNTETLKQLCYASFAAGILPYYLHVPDLVSGTAHFNVSADEALDIYRELQAEVPGYLLPRLVSEIPGKSSKTLLT